MQQKNISNSSISIIDNVEWTNPILFLENFQSIVKPQLNRPEKINLLEYSRYDFYLDYFKYKNWINIFLSVERWYIQLILYGVEREFILVYGYEDYCNTEEAIITNYKLTKEEYQIVDLALHHPEILRDKKLAKWKKRNY